MSGKLTQSALSFACGMPISSKVAGPLDGFGLPAGAVAAELAVLVLAVGEGRAGRSWLGGALARPSIAGS